MFRSLDTTYREIILSFKILVFRRVAKIDKNTSVLEIYDSISEAAKKNKIDPHTLRDRLSGKYSSKNKDKFKYVN